MKFIASLLLCLFFTISECSEDVIIYFGIHESAASKFIAITLNDLTNGIALQIPIAYIKKASFMVVSSIVLIIVYRNRKALFNHNEPPKECLCDHCIDRLSEQVDS